jgi:addiction module RelE/StbE family toxin
LKVRWTPHARHDLSAIGRYIARDKPGAARRWVERLRQRAKKAAEMPYAGRVVPEEQREDIREVLVVNYRIMYRVHDDAIEVLTVLEGHQQFPHDAIPDDED